MKSVATSIQITPGLTERRAAQQHLRHGAILERGDADEVGGGEGEERVGDEEQPQRDEHATRDEARIGHLFGERRHPLKGGEDEDADRDGIDQIAGIAQAREWLMQCEAVMRERHDRDDGERDEQPVGGDVLEQPGDADAEEIRASRQRQDQQISRELRASAGRRS